MSDELKFKCLAAWLEARNAARLAKVKAENAAMRSQFAQTVLCTTIRGLPDIFRRHMATRFDLELR